MEEKRIQRDLEEIIKILNDLKPYLKEKYKVEILGIFGSFARGEAKETSDIDILVDFERGATLFELVGLSLFLEEKLGTKVDIVPKRALRKELKETVIGELVRV